MKKTITLLLTVTVLFSCLSVCAMAEEENNLYNLLANLLNGREITLTVTAENVECLEEILAPYGTVVCTGKQEENGIVLNVTCDGEAFAAATADGSGVHLETNLLELTLLDLRWETLLPRVTLTKDGDSVLKVSMTGPEQELINFTCKVQGDDLNNLKLSFQGGFITGPGAVYGLWDDLTSRDGKTTRDFCVTFAESEVLVAGSGEETVETAEDGTLTITRVEECTVFMDEEEIGTLTIRSVLSIQ